MQLRNSVAIAAIAFSALLAGCSSPTNTTAYPGSSTSAAVSYGVVESIQPVNTRSGGVGLGTIAGGVVGGVLGNQVGGGTGRTAATAAGAIGGAMVGNQVDQRNRTQANAYQLGVRLDNGGYQTVTQESLGDVSVGNRVRIENNRATRY